MGGAWAAPAGPGMMLPLTPRARAAESPLTAPRGRQGHLDGRRRQDVGLTRLLLREKEFMLLPTPMAGFLKKRPESMPDWIAFR